MGKGLGRVQRVILALIAANPDGAWTTKDLSLAAYPHARAAMKMRRVAVLHALHRLRLPGTWNFRRLHRAPPEFCLYDPCSDESQTRVRWLRDRREPDYDR